jgi:putative membrane protein
MTTDTIIQKAAFNNLIKSYLFWYIAFVLLISVIGIILLPIWLLGVGQWWTQHYFDKLTCELTDRSLHFKKGILVQIEKTIPLENIQDITFIEGPILRRFNLCILRLETAGQSIKGGGEMDLVGIIDAQDFRQKVLQQRQLLMDRKQVNAPEVTGNQVILIEIRDSLRQIADILKKQNG